MAGRFLNLLSGEMLEETRKNMESLIEGTNRLVKEMKSLTKALQSHEKMMRELLAAVEKGDR